MQKSFIFVLLVCYLSLFCDPKDPYVVAVTEGEPSASVADAVSAITGDFYISNPDIVVTGVEPIVIDRNYISGNGRGRLAGFSFSSNLTIVSHALPNGFLEVVEPSGTVLRYTISLKNLQKMGQKKYKKNPVPMDLQEHWLFGFVNRRDRANFKKNRVELNPDEEHINIYGPDGRQRCYQKIPATKQQKKELEKNKLAPDLNTYVYTLMWEKLPNGNYINYGYDPKHRLNGIYTSDPARKKTFASLLINYINDTDYDITTNDGKTIQYRYESRGGKENRYFLMRRVHNNSMPDEYMEFNDPESYRGQLLVDRHLLDNRYLHIDYYRPGDNQAYAHNVYIGGPDEARCDRVKTLLSPIGVDSSPVATHSFHYNPGQRGNSPGSTDVYDAMGNLTTYRYSPLMMLESIDRFSKTETGQTLNHTERFFWESGGNLLCKAFYDENGKAIFARTFVYDGNGNVIRERLYGNLSGQCIAPVVIRGDGSVEENGIESYGKSFSYSDERNLLRREEEDNGRSIVYNYYCHNRLDSKFELHHGRIVHRTFYEYDGDLVLIKEIIDDGATEDKNNLNGVTERKIKVMIPKHSDPYYGMPEVIEERALDLRSNQEILLKKVALTFGSYGLITKRDVYDARGVFRYSLQTTYDQKGRVIEETNALGQVAKSTYDSVGNKLTFQDFHGKSTIHMTYDYANRLVQSEERTYDSNLRTTQHRYNLLNQRTQTIDFRGNSTFYSYDPFGHLLEEKSPDVLDENGTKTSLATQMSYDSAGNKVQILSPKGEATKTLYNVYGKPTEITYADGSTEQFIYNLDGTLAKAIDQNGVSTVYSYDTFGRETSKRIYTSSHELLTEETFVYAGFRLVEKIDAENHRTQFTYDCFSRKIAEERAGEKIEYSYDDLGRIKEEKKENLVAHKEFDLLDRVVEEKMEDESGQLLARTLNEYDSFGNIKSITRFIAGQDAIEAFHYDSFNRPIEQIDALGHMTRFEYDDTQNKRTHIDALGTATIETRDALNRLISTEKKNIVGDTISKEELFYDGHHNLSRQLSTVYASGAVINTLTTLWEYGQLNRLLTLTEAADTADQKITRYSYTRKSQLHKTFKPDGTILENSYDDLGRIVALTASDRSLSYAFVYNKLGQMIACENQLTGNATQRTLDAQGRVLKETLETGFSFENEYDNRGRRTVLHLPDNSSVNYSYDALYLRTVNRNNYTHQYLEYDLSGHLLREQMIAGLGEINYKVDLLGRAIELTSPYLEEKIEKIDALGHIQRIFCKTGSLFDAADYEYDDLYQLTNEGGAFFANRFKFDSHYNRLSKDDGEYQINAANELLSTDKVQYVYDDNGCPIRKITQSGTIEFKYDALGRLLEATQEEKFHVEFTYDGLHRRLTKTLYVWEDQNWQKKTVQNFLYDGQCEIGAADEEGKIRQLRILGSAPRAEIGAAIAIELEGRLFAPVHDIKGNVRLLYDIELQKIPEIYRYSAYGEETIRREGYLYSDSIVNCPWRFLSKRIDEELQMIFFGRRYYEPETGRWLTPDPKGFADSLNLYAFVFNDPLTRVDLWGLETLVEQGPSGRSMMDFFRPGLEHLKNGVNLVGRCISNFSFHCVPIPFIRQTIQAIGHLMSGVRGPDKRYYPTPHNDKVGNGENPYYEINYGPGILNGPEVLQDAKILSNMANNCEINVTHDDSRGLVLDLWDAAIGKMGFQTAGSKHHAEYLKGAIEKARKSGKLGVIDIVSSRGGIAVKNALKLLSPEEQDMVHIRSIGSADLFKPNNHYSVEHYVSSRDIILFASPINFIKSRFSPSNIHLIPSAGGKIGIDHGFRSKTYQNRLKEVLYEFSNEN